MSKRDSRQSAQEKQHEFSSPQDFLKFYESLVLGFELKDISRVNTVVTKRGMVYSIPDDTFRQIEQLAHQLRSVIRSSRVIVSAENGTTLKLIQGGKSGAVRQ